MIVARSAKQILDKIKCPYLDLVRVPGRDGGYWYFVYDDMPNNIYETESVYVMRLNDMDVDRWVDTGKDLVKRCEAKKAERNADMITDEIVERAAKALEKKICQDTYEWSDELFEIWWNDDPRFTVHETGWGYFRGTRKQKALYEARIILEAALPDLDKK